MPTYKRRDQDEACTDHGALFGDDADAEDPRVVKWAGAFNPPAPELLKVLGAEAVQRDTSTSSSSPHYM